MSVDRRCGIGGSDIGAIAGLNPYVTPLQVYLEKVEGLEIEENEAMRWGKLLEPVIAGEYQRQLPDSLLCEIGVGRHNDHPWWIGSPDRLVFSDFQTLAYGLEIKTSRFGKGYGPAGTDQVPPHVIAQVQWYMGLIDCARWDVACLIGGSELRIYTVERDQVILDRLFEAGKRFWFEHVEPKIPPELKEVEL